MRQRYPLVGLGQPALPDISSLPGTGDLSSQLTQGQNLITNAKSVISGIASGNPDSRALAGLLSQGMAMSNSIPSSSQLGTIVRDVMTIGSATALGATSGPWGAAVGAVVSSIEVLIQSLFGSGGGGNVVYVTGEPTRGATHLYNLVKQWGQMANHFGLTSGSVMGWTFYDYLARKYPPSGMTAANAQIVWGDVVSNIYNAEMTPSAGHVAPHDPTTTVNSRQQLAEEYFKTNYQQYGPCSSSSSQPFEASCVKWPGGNQPDYEKYLKIVNPLATAVFWEWGQPCPSDPCPPGSLDGVQNNEFFTKAAQQSIGELYAIWQGDTSPIRGNNGRVLSVQQIMNYAERHRPSSMFFASDLYVVQMTGRNQCFGNCETMSGVATACGILAAGGSCQTVLSELLIQQAILQTLDGKVSPLFRMLVEEYLAKAQVERATAAAGAGIPGADLSTAGKVGAVAAGATGAVLFAILAYSAATKTSPVETTKLGLARAGRLFKR